MSSSVFLKSLFSGKGNRIKTGSLSTYMLKGCEKSFFLAELTRLQTNIGVARAHIKYQFQISPKIDKFDPLGVTVDSVLIKIINDISTTIGLIQNFNHNSPNRYNVDAKDFNFCKSRLSWLRETYDSLVSSLIEQNNFDYDHTYGDGGISCAYLNSVYAHVLVVENHLCNYVGIKNCDTQPYTVLLEYFNLLSKLIFLLARRVAF